MATSSKRKRLLDAYRFIGFRPLEQLEGVFGDPKARVVTLVRRSKKRPALPQRHHQRHRRGIASGMGQRRAYGLRNEEYLRLKILTCMLPAF